MVSGRHPEPIEKHQLHAKGDGRTPGNRKVGTPSTELVARSQRTNRDGQPAAFDHRTLPKLPANLGKRGRAEWFKIFDHGPWLQPHQDWRWVEMIARSYDDIEAFRKQIELDGLMIKNHNGADVANPLLREVRSCEATIMKCLSILGFSPSDRARLGQVEVKTRQGIADLQRKAQDQRG